MRFSAGHLILSILIVFTGAGKTTFASTIDLHSHLFMQDGMGPLLWGDFDEPAKANSASSRFRTKMTRESLDASGLKVIVVAFYAHPVLTRGSVRDSLLRQIAQAEQFVSENPDWVVAGEPSEARFALAAGKRVFVFSVETAAGAFENEADRDLFIDEKKIRIVTFMHLSPDRLGRGVALWPGLGVMNCPLEVIEAWTTQNKDPVTGAYLNPYGLTSFGKSVLEDLVRRKVWIDLAHSSDRAQREIVEVLDRFQQPSLITHTKLREIAKNERTLPQFSIDRVNRTHGMIGLIPTDEMTQKMSRKEDGKENCRQGIYAFAEEWKRAEILTGNVGAVALGSDFNSPLPGLRGGCSEVANSDSELAAKGFYRGDDLPRLFTAMRALGAGSSPEKTDPAIEHFIQAWERVRPKAPQNKKKQSESESARLKQGAPGSPRF